MPESKSIHYRVAKFRLKHFDSFKAREVQRPEIEFLFKNEEIQKFWIFVMPVFTLFANEEPILIYGMQNSGSGTYYPMVYAAEGIDKHVRAVIRCLYDYAEKFVNTDIRRFEAYVSATDKKAIKLAKFFGFEAVGFRRQAAMDGGDQIIYERLWRK